VRFFLLISTRSALAALAFLFVVPVSASSQERRPTVTLIGGLGNVLGGLGAGGEYYFAGSRLSVGVGLGYWPEESVCNQGTFSGAGALRGFIGSRHRGFLELSYSLLAISCFQDAETIDRHYGPGLSLGYRYIGTDGFTFTGGVGVGNGPDEVGAELLILLGLGYTWRR
jgi:hypothetical protein